jgi:small subunit ribosomal protein S6
MEQADATAAAAKVRDFILSLGASIKKETAWEKRKLAYPIKKQTAGFYFILEMDLEPEKIAELKNYLKLNNDVLREMIIDTSRIKPSKARTRISKPKTVAPIETISSTATSEKPVKKEKVKIEELDKKLEELLKE